MAAKTKLKTGYRYIVQLDSDIDKLEPKTGRPAKQISLAIAEKLYAMHCTDEEVAAFFGVAVRTVERRKKKADFLEISERGRSLGRISLRRLQWLTANSPGHGQSTMQIWLGKQLLNQKDRIANEHSGPDGAAIEVTDARSKLLDLLTKRNARSGPAPAPVKTDEPGS